MKMSSRVDFLQSPLIGAYHHIKQLSLEEVHGGDGQPFTAQRRCHQGCHDISEGRIRVSYRDETPLKPLCRTGVSVLVQELLCIRDVMKVIVNHQ